jgi:hypothetical protein
MGIEKYQLGRAFHFKANPTVDPNGRSVNWGDSTDRLDLLTIDVDWDGGAVLANGAQWQSDKADLRLFAADGTTRLNQWAREFLVRARTDPASTPTDGAAATYRLGTSHSPVAATGNDGNFTGANGTYANTGDNELVNTILLGDHVQDDNDTQEWGLLGRFIFPTPFVQAHIDNNTGVNIADEGFELLIIEILNAEND